MNVGRCGAQCSFSEPGSAFAGVPYQALAERLIRLAERERSNFKMPAVMMVFWALVRLEVPVSEAFLDGMAGAYPFVAFVPIQDYILGPQSGLTRKHVRVTKPDVPILALQKQGTG